MRNWSHGLMFAALLSVVIVISLMAASCTKGDGFELDIDLPKVSVPKKATPAKKTTSKVK